MEAMNFAPGGSEISLQLRSMPDLRAMLVTKKEDERAPRVTEQRYGPKVLEGNWFDKRAEPAPCKDEWNSIFETSYRPYGERYLIKDKFEPWDNRIHGQGLGARIMMDHHGTAYHDNISTTYDLSYRVTTEGTCGPKKRTFNARNKEWVPVQDFTTNYGNLTNYGLMESMKCKWLIESKEPLRPWRTEYQDDFKGPDPQPASSDKRFPRRIIDMNVPDLRHLGIDLSPYASCPIAHKLPNAPTYRTELKPPDTTSPGSGHAPEKNRPAETTSEC